MNKASRVATKSIKRMKNFGTILKFLILNILFLISFKFRGVFEVINEIVNSSNTKLDNKL